MIVFPVDPVGAGLVDSLRSRARIGRFPQATTVTADGSQLTHRGVGSPRWRQRAQADLLRQVPSPECGREKGPAKALPQYLPHAATVGTANIGLLSHAVVEKLPGLAP
jgi:hypothetical protein